MNDRTKLADELRAAGAELDKDPNASMRDALKFAETYYEHRDN